VVASVSQAGVQCMVGTEALAVVAKLNPFDVALLVKCM
jgi:hypothetical protein